MNAGLTLLLASLTMGAGVIQQPSKQASTTFKSRGSSEIEMGLAFPMPSCKKAFHVQLVVLQQKRVKRKQSNGGLGTFSIAERARERERDQF